MFSAAQSEPQLPQKDAETLNSVLPIFLTPKDVEENPDFAGLLQQLTRLVHPHGVSADVQKDLQQAKETLRHAKHSWLQLHILHHEVQEMILDYDIRAQDTGISAADKEFKEMLEQCLNYAEAKNYLSFNPDPGSKVTLFGLNQDDIQEHNPYKRHISSLQLKLIPELEDRLRQRAENLVNVYYASSSVEADSSGLSLAKASQLPGLVERTILKLEEEKKKLKQTRLQREKQFWLYFQTMLESLGHLERMVNEFRLGNQSQNNTVTTEWLVARCDAMCLKIKYVEMQILCDTYTTETVAALTKIRDSILEATDSAEKDLHRVKLALDAYNAVGSGFTELVEEYGRLQSELENKKWALKEFDTNK